MLNLETASISPDFLPNLTKALEKGTVFTVSEGAQGIDIQSASLLTRAFSAGATPHYERQCANIASVVTRLLKSHAEKGKPLKDEDPLMKITRLFIAKVPKVPALSETLKQFETHAFAAKLGVPIETFNESINPGFFAYAQKARIDRHLLLHKHTLQVDKTTFKISILREGRFCSWESIPPSALQPPKKLANRDLMYWGYGKNGVQSKDMFNWKELKPYKQVDPKWKNRYIFQFHICVLTRTQCVGSHGWLELQTPKGEVYSAGLYRVGGKPGMSKMFEDPMRVTCGAIQSPDCSPLWPMPQDFLEVEITREQFTNIKKSIEEDHALDKRPFQSLHHSCPRWVNEKLALAGKQIPVTSAAIRHLIPLPLLKVIDLASPYIPEIILKTARMAAACFINGLQLCLGAGKIDPSFAQKVPGFQAPLSWWDWFNHDKAYVAHPSHIADVFNEVRAWRNKLIERLPKEVQEYRKSWKESQEQQLPFERNKDFDEQLADIELSLPPEFRLGPVEAKPLPAKL